MTDEQGYQSIGSVKVTLHARLGSSRLKVREVEALRPGAVVTLDRLAGEPVELLCRGQVIARGEVMIQDETFALRLTEIVQRGKSDELRQRRLRGRK